MGRVTAIELPPDSLLAGFGGAGDYRDCFAREVPNPAGREITLADYIEHFYCSMAFRPERLVLGLIARGATDADALARGETSRIAVWEVVERDDKQILLHAKGTGTASWLAVEPGPSSTRLLFGSWVGNLKQSWWRFTAHPHQWYSRALLAGVRLD